MNIMFMQINSVLSKCTTSVCFSGLLNIVANIMVHAVIPLSDIYGYITAVRVSLVSLGLEIFTVPYLVGLWNNHRSIVCNLNIKYHLLVSIISCLSNMLFKILT